MRNLITKFGRTTKERRKLLGLLQPDLANISGVSRRSIQDIEQGKSNPRLETLLKLAEPLGLTIELVIIDPSKTNQS